MKTSRMNQCAVIVALCLVLSTGGVLYASSDLPEEAIGYDAESTYNISDYESINLANGNLGFRLPLYSLSTDGGLTYNLALRYNSKMWESRSVCVEGACTPGEDCDQCLPASGNDDKMMSMEIATGIESYGFGWDLRPARIEPSDLQAPGVKNAFAWVDATGAKHHLAGDEAWNHGGNHIPCVFSAANPSCYTVDGSNFRLTATEFDGEQPSKIVAEAPDGTRFIHTHLVSPLEQNVVHLGTAATFAEEAAAFNFRTGVGGLYLTSIEKGPWPGGTPANKITFDYCGIGESDCPSGAWKWLVEKIAVEDPVSHDDKRAIEIEYSGGYQVHPDSGNQALDQYILNTFVINKVTIPKYSPVAGDTATADIDFVFSNPTFQQFNAYFEGYPIDPFASLQVPTLTSVAFPDGGTFHFGIETNKFPLGSVTFPTGAKINYVFTGWPISKPRPAGTTQFCEYVNTRQSLPDQNEYHSDGGGHWSYSDGLAMRLIEYEDAFGERQETTWYRAGISCEETIPTSEIEWPFNFDYALLDAGYRAPYRFVYVAKTSIPFNNQLSPTEFYDEYVATQQDDSRTADPAIWDIEIHRFTLGSFEEFSVDHLDLSDTARLYLPAEDYTMEPLMHDENSAWRVLRHEEIEHTELFDVGKWLAPYPYGGTNQQEFARYSYVNTRRIYTDEGSAATEDPSDVRLCYPAYDWDNPDDPSCALVTTTVEVVDDYLNEEITSTTFTDPTTSTAKTRTTTQIYDDVYQNNDRWYLGLKTQSNTCIDTDCVTQGWNWEWRNEQYVVAWEFNNPAGAPGSASCIEGDCISHEYTYDDFGNPTTDKIGGGYGNDYSDTTAYTTETTYSEGRAQKKEIVPISGDPLLLWEREIDPETGLVRWHVDGSGAGFAYNYNAMRKVTEIFPIDGEYDSGWTFSNSMATDIGEIAPLYGTQIEYDFPEAGGNEFLTHTVRDVDCAVSEDSIDLNSCTTEGTTRAIYSYDGLGRRQQVTEYIPAAGGGGTTRKRFDLHLHTPAVADGDLVDSCYTQPLQGGLATVGPFVRSSRWINGNTVVTDCGDIPNWGITQMDGLGRPRRAFQLDESVTGTDYWGDTISQTTWSVVTSLDNSVAETDFTTTQTKDALGRLREVIEEVTSNTYVTSTYGYDVADRLLSVAVDGAEDTQDRSFTFSSGGFLTSSSEPERTTSYTAYNALGNPTALTEDLTNVSLTYDEWGRNTKKTIGTFTASTFQYGDIPVGSGNPGDPRGDDTSGIGDPSYNKVVIATQNNWFGVNPVAVTDEWWHEGPGGAVSQHQTEISGFGDDRFTVNYLYDRWGNQSWIGHPLWGSTLGCQPDVAQYRHFDGSWLNAVEANYVGNDGETIASFEYDLNGRVENTKFGPTGGIRPTLTEAQDDSGMARPKSFTLYDDQSGEVWGTGEYAYDGSGNISEIGDKRYSYDGLNRLTAYSLNEGTTVTESYDYDDFGNMESLTKSVGTNLAMVYNSSNLITSINGATLTPDTRGNITGMPFVANLLREKTFVFSNEDRMMESVDYGALPDSSDDVTWRYAYNSAGERVARWLPSATPNAPTEVRLNLRDEGGQVLNDWLWLADGNSPTLATQRDYIYGPNGMVAQMDWERGKTLFAATDHLGHTRVLFDENFDIPDDDLDLIDFAPYGEQITGAESPGTTHLFTGHERDWEDTASELDYMHARYYSPYLARFVSVDPVGGTVGSSQSWNRYSYVEGNPVSFVDSSGKVKVRATRGHNMNGDKTDFFTVHFETYSKYTKWAARIGTAINIIQLVDEILNWYVNDTSDIPLLDHFFEKHDFEKDLKIEFKSLAKKSIAYGSFNDVYTSEEFNKLDEAVSRVIKKWKENGIEIDSEQESQIRESYRARAIKKGAREKGDLVGEDEGDKLPGADNAIDGWSRYSRSGYIQP